MFVVAITGNAASGKSLFTEIFLRLAGEGAECFDCDRCVHELTADPEILADITEYFGERLIDLDGNLDRTALREKVFASDCDRLFLEGLLHPKVLEQAELAMSEAAAREIPPTYLLFEIPLLYEVDFSLQRDTDVVVAASLEVRLRRLKDKRGLSDEVIEQILKVQLPMEEKISRAQQVIWNDGCEDELLQEAHLLKAWIDKKVGE